MTGAVAAVQAAVVAALAGHPGLAGLTGVFDGPPARAAYPYAAIGGGAASDWSCKTARGREQRLVVSLWDDGARVGRLHALVAAAEDAIEALPAQIDGHRVASLVLARSRIVRDADGPWAGIVEYRVRTLEG